MSDIQGRRLPDDSDIREVVACDYFRVRWTGGANEWWFRDPNGTPGRITTHTVTEHDDGTITVSPSIAGGGWHGYLKAGVWSGNSESSGG